MGYINFKEENKVAIKQLKNRKENNNKILKEIYKDRTLIGNYSPYEKLSYKRFEGESFGARGVEKEENFMGIEKKDIICSSFINCKFKNIAFKNCNFIGCIFEKCEFLGGGVLFENCNFIKEESYAIPNLNEKDNFSCGFKSCRFYTKFLKCNLSYAYFENCMLKKSFLKDTDISSVIIYKSELNILTIEDCSLMSFKVIDTYIENLEFTDKMKSKLDEKSYFDKIPIKKKSKSSYEGIYNVYQIIANKFKENNLNNNFGEYYYLCKKTQHKSLKPFPKFTSYIYYISCGYGERPQNALLFSIFIMFVFGFIYMITGIELNGKSIGVIQGNLGNINIHEFFYYYKETLNLSVGMFSGVGFIDGKPDISSYNIVNIEMIIGVIMMGVGIGTLTRKIVR